MVPLPRSREGARLRVPPAPQVQTSLSLGIPCPLPCRTVPVVPGGVPRGQGSPGQAQPDPAMPGFNLSFLSAASEPPAPALAACGTATAAQVSGPPRVRQRLPRVRLSCMQQRWTFGLQLPQSPSQCRIVLVVRPWAPLAAHPYAPVGCLLLAGLSSASGRPLPPGSQEPPSSRVLDGEGATPHAEEPVLISRG